MNKVELLAASGIAMAAVLIFMKFRRNKEMKLTDNDKAMLKEMGENMTKGVEKAGTSPLTEAAKLNLTERILGMSQEELELVADTIPIELCLKRIHKELDRAKNFESLVKNAIGSLN